MAKEVGDEGEENVLFRVLEYCRRRGLGKRRGHHREVGRSGKKAEPIVCISPPQKKAKAGSFDENEVVNSKYC